MTKISAQRSTGLARMCWREAAGALPTEFSRGPLMRFTPIRDAIPVTAVFILAGLLMASPLALATAETETEADSASAPAEAAETSEAAPESAEPAASETEDSAGEAATEAEAESAAETGDAEAEAGVEAAAEDNGYLLGDVVLGEADAPVTVVEYASF